MSDPFKPSLGMWKHSRMFIKNLWACSLCAIKANMALDSDFEANKSRFKYKRGHSEANKTKCVVMPSLALSQHYASQPITTHIREHCESGTAIPIQNEWVHQYQAMWHYMLKCGTALRYRNIARLNLDASICIHMCFLMAICRRSTPVRHRIPQKMLQ